MTTMYVYKRHLTTSTQIKILRWNLSLNWGEIHNILDIPCKTLGICKSYIQNKFYESKMVNSSLRHIITWEWGRRKAEHLNYNSINHLSVLLSINTMNKYNHIY